MDTKRWEYLVSPQFNIRKVIAVEYLKDCETIIDVGAFKKKLPIKHNATLYTIDPLETISEAFHGKFSDWIKSEPILYGKVGVALLGFDFEGDDYEWEHLVSFLQNVDVIVLECATEFDSSMSQMNKLLLDLHSIFAREARFQLDLPDIDIDGFPVFNLRTINILKRIK
jgi:hypothetical protein